MSEAHSPEKQSLFKKIISYQLDQPFLLAFTGTLLLSLLRLKMRFIEPFLWAEDGSDFFTIAVCDDKIGLFEPIAGLLLPLQRLIAWICFRTSLYFSAELISLSSLIIFSISAAYVAKKNFRNFVPSDSLRILLALLAPVIAGSPEILGNLICIVYPLTWLLTLQILELVVIKATPRLIFSAIALSLANPLAFTTIPMQIVIWAKNRSQAKYFIFLSGILSSCISVYLSSRISVGAADLQFGLFKEIPKAILDTFIGYSVLTPFLGEVITTAFFTLGAPTMLLIGIALLAILLYLIAKTSSPSSLLIYVWLVPITYSAAHLVTRKVSIDPFDLGFIPSLSRCLFLFSMPSALIAFGCYQPNRQGLQLFGLIPIGLLIGAFLPISTAHWHLNYGAQDDSWSRFRSHFNAPTILEDWKSEVGVYPFTSFENQQPVPWAIINISKQGNSFDCKLKGGNYGELILGFGGR